jgi:hypothetical protein
MKLLLLSPMNWARGAGQGQPDECLFSGLVPLTPRLASKLLSVECVGTFTSM